MIAVTNTKQGWFNFLELLDEIIEKQEQGIKSNSQTNECGFARTIITFDNEIEVLVNGFNLNKTSEEKHNWGNFIVELPVKEDDVKVMGVPFILKSSNKFFFYIKRENVRELEPFEILAVICNAVKFIEKTQNIDHLLEYKA